MSKKRAQKRIKDVTSSEDEDIQPKKLKSDEELPKTTNVKSNNIPEKEIDDEGNEYFLLGRDRRISSSTFKGKRLISIREYYEDKKSGKMKPGKKGITLNAIEWKNLLGVADQLHIHQEE